jgi:cytidine deaminase
VIFEFSDASTEVVMEGPGAKAVVRKISELLPEAFGPKDLGVSR